jgi:hypothetical protein
MKRRLRCLARPVAPLLAMLAMSACHWLHSGDPTPFHPVAAGTVKDTSECVATCRDSVDIVAMGVGGFLIVPWRDSTRLVMTPPSYTNPTIGWIAFGNWWRGSSPNRARIERRLASMPAAGVDRLSRVAAVLVGHGHYDHLMDVPYLARYLGNATVYGSRSSMHLLNPVRAFGGIGTPTSRLVPIDSLAGVDSVKQGTSFPVGNAVSVRAIAWEHAPNFGNHVIARGDEPAPRTTLPRGLFGWKLGRVYAYAIDLLDAQGAVSCRIVVHDAGASPEVSRRAASVIRTMASARHTVLIITAANFDQEPSYPDVLLAQLAPQHVLLGHWEDFFRSSEKKARVVRGIRAQQLADIVTRHQGTRWTTLDPGATLRLRY